MTKISSPLPAHSAFVKPIRLHQCAICLRVDAWGEGWESFGSYALDEEDSAAMARVCSDLCKARFTAGLESRSITVPEVKYRGYAVKITGKVKGCERQPDQRALLEIYNGQVKKAADAAGKETR